MNRVRYPPHHGGGRFQSLAAGSGVTLAGGCPTIEPQLRNCFINRNRLAIVEERPGGRIGSPKTGASREPLTGQAAI